MSILAGQNPAEALKSEIHDPDHIFTPPPPHLDQASLFYSKISFLARKRFPAGSFYSGGAIFIEIFALSLTVLELYAKNWKSNRFDFRKTRELKF